VLDPRAIATLGIGYGADLLARIGLWPSTAVIMPPLKYRSGTGFSTAKPPQIRPVEDEEAFLLSVLL